jgi:glycosyltransferase involved in cell wall biosynthesis
MIVKDEAHIITRCLDSALPWIDHWVIVDTGSSDGTQATVRRHLGQVPGELHERPWQNFAKNRNEALELGRSKADYLLFLDADDVLGVPAGSPRPELVADAHYVRMEVGGSTSFSRVNLVSTRLPWRWEGAVHEVITCPEPHRIEHLPGWTIRSLSDSARNRDPVGKFVRDAAMLEAAVAEDPTGTRNVFYLAQSYRDAGDLARAIEWYGRRAEMGGWDEEIWYSRFQIAVLHERRGDWDRALPAYLAAFQYRPTRLEPLCELARHYRVAQEHALAHLFASAAVDRPAPGDILFLDDSVYAWRALDEYAISAYWVGKYEESLRANDRLLTEGKLPATERARIEQNRAFCLGKLRPG